MRSLLELPEAATPQSATTGPVLVMSRHEIVRASLAAFLTNRCNAPTVVTSQWVQGRTTTVCAAVLLHVESPNDVRDLTARFGPAVVAAYTEKLTKELAKAGTSAGVRYFFDRTFPVDRVSAGLGALLDQRAEADRAAARPLATCELLDQLTLRQRQVLTLVASGMSNDTIAQTMFITVNTLKAHIRAAYAQIGVCSRVQAVRWGMQHGLGQLDPMVETQCGCEQKAEPSAS
ncbi:response regulator transcription factor [Rudaeicoccus suwonensis]|uniref:DNA-binding NarL/FixJ family response regulator n=1 Tax=Rudaeicoccus suwonensis TaxID=657409 RepID=A0A561E3M7_9MICO|nr:LuxR C-terminal-related transcriptional regulator [Rudaeicoccus suwonensis]TWE10214.1 DNA-binding NarL/FixJ family response regulator [Rudaeicoccus suwonensis]